MTQNTKKKNGNTGGGAKAAGSRKTGGGSSSTAGKKSASSRKKSAASGSRASSSSRKPGTASASKRASASKSASADSARRNAARESVRLEKELREREIRTTIGIIGLLVLMLFVFLSLLGYGRGVGKALADMLFGFFGIGAWFFPAYITLYCILLITRKGGRQRLPRMLALLLLLVAAQTAAHLKLHASHVITLETPFNAAEIFRRCAEEQAGGGVVGGWIARLMYRAFGIVVSGILLAGLALVSLIQIFRFSPAGFLRGLQKRHAGRETTDFRERRGFYRQKRIEELEREEDEALERQTERYLRREDELERRAQAKRERQARRRAGRRVSGPELDLEQILVSDPGRQNRTGNRGREAGASGSRRNAGSGSTTRRDVHEITVLTAETADPLTIPAAGGRGASGPVPARNSHDRGGAPSAYGTAAVRGSASRGAAPEPDGTRYERSSTDPARHSAALPSEGGGRSGSSAGSALTGSGSSSARVPGTSGKTDVSVHEAGGNIREPVSAGAADRPAAGGSRGSGETSDTGSARDPDRAAYTGSVPEPEKTAAAAGVPGSGGTDTANLQELQEISVHREKNSQKTGPVGRTAHSGRGSTYTAPPFSLLEKGDREPDEETDRELQETAYRLQETLRTFGVQVTITDISRGPSVTRYELKPDQGVKVSRIVNLSDDIKLRLAATDIRIEAPIPGKSAIGIEVPNRHTSTVQLRELLESREFRKNEGRLPFTVGRDIGGKIIIADIARMPHLLIAGATGSGKSVCINTIILSILYKTSPDQVRLLMIDPKVVELSVYQKIPHLIIPVVTDARKASAALNWAVAEMENRYKLFAAAGVRDLNGYNALAEEWRQKIETESGFSAAIRQGAGSGPLPRLVIIVDELADLMMVSKSEVESSICRLAQLARAAGIHLIIATQRPSVDVITGLIKANMPSRIAFAVSSQVDSRTILDMAGAEKLIGKGDMLFYPQNYQKPARIQGAFVSDNDVIKVVDYIRNNNAGRAQAQESESGEIDRQIESIQENGMPSGGAEETKAVPGRDELFAEAGRFIIEKNKASIGLLQRVFKIGFNRAARIMDQLAEAGVVSEESSTRARQVLMSMPEFENYLENET